eukprot:1769217-Alexandrium_andersonii.AAC.1
MSASLVGSEMCIRDRLMVDGASSVSRRGRMHMVQPAYLKSMRSRFPQAVSYTHLTLPTICSV